MAMPRPRGIQSVTQSRVNVYTRGDNWSCVPVNSCMYSTKSSLNMSDTVPSRSTLLDESGELHSTKVEPFLDFSEWGLGTRLGEP